MPHKPTTCLFEWETYQNQRIQNPNVRLKLSEEEIRNLGMQCIRDCYTNIDCPHSNISDPTSQRKRLQILKERARSLKIAGNLESAYLLYFLCAKIFRDIAWTGDCIDISNSGARISLTRVYDLLQEFLDKNKKQLEENSGDCSSLIAIVKELMISTKYHVMATSIFCELVLTLQTINRPKKRELEGEAIDSMILALENHHQKMTENDPAYIEAEPKLVEKAKSLLHKLLKKPSSQRNPVLSGLLE